MMVFGMFVYQLTLYTIELKKDKGTGYVIALKSKGVHTSKLKSLHTAFLHSLKLSGYRMRTKFDKEHLVVEQNNCAAKIVNATLSMI